VHLVCVDYNNVISAVCMRSEKRLVLAPEK
jgi:hypothetical protein